MFHEIHVLLVYPIESSQPSQQGISISICNIKEYRDRGRIIRGMGCFHSVVKTHAKHDMKARGSNLS